MASSLSAALADAETDCRQHASIDARIKACTAVIKDIGDVMPLWYLFRAQAYLEKKNTKLAIADYSKAIAIDSKAPAGMRQMLPNYYNARGNVYLDIGDYDRAAADYSKEIELADGDILKSTAHVHRAIALARKGKCDEAIADGAKAIAYQAKSHTAYAARGLGYACKGDTAAALAEYAKGIEVDPKPFLAHRFRGELYEKQGDKQKAIDEFRTALRFSPDNAPIKAGLKRLGATP